MKKVASLLLVFSLITVLAACGSGESKNENAGEGTSLYDKIKEEGKLLIGTEGTYPPFTFHNESGKLTGFDVEIAREVAKRLGVKPVFKETKWDAMFAGLNSERFDMIANEVGKLPNRKEKYDFSNTYISSSAVLVTHKNNNKIKSFEDIKGIKSAQTLTSNYADIAKEYGADIVSVEGFNQAMKLLATKRVAVTINDRLSVLTYKKKQPNAPVKIVDRKKNASEIGFMFREGNPELIKAVNKALKDMKKDGTYDKIFEKWFGTDDTK